MRTGTRTGYTVCAGHTSAGEGYCAQASGAPAPRCSFRRSRARHAEHRRDNPRGTGQWGPWKVDHISIWRFFKFVSILCPSDMSHYSSCSIVRSSIMFVQTLAVVRVGLCTIFPDSTWSLTSRDLPRPAMRPFLQPSMRTRGEVLYPMPPRRARTARCTWWPAAPPSRRPHESGRTPLAGRVSVSFQGEARVPQFDPGAHAISIYGECNS